MLGSSIFVIPPIIQDMGNLDQLAQLMHEQDMIEAKNPILKPKKLIQRDRNAFQLRQKTRRQKQIKHK